MNCIGNKQVTLSNYNLVELPEIVAAKISNDHLIIITENVDCILIMQPGLSSRNTLLFRRIS